MTTPAPLDRPNTIEECLGNLSEVLKKAMYAAGRLRHTTAVAYAPEADVKVIDDAHAELVAELDMARELMLPTPEEIATRDARGVVCVACRLPPSRHPRAQPCGSTDRSVLVGWVPAPPVGAIGDRAAAAREPRPWEQQGVAYGRPHPRREDWLFLGCSELRRRLDDLMAYAQVDLDNEEFLREFVTILRVVRSIEIGTFGCDDGPDKPTTAPAAATPDRAGVQ